MPVAIPVSNERESILNNPHPESLHLTGGEIESPKSCRFLYLGRLVTRGAGGIVGFTLYRRSLGGYSPSVRKPPESSKFIVENQCWMTPGGENKKHVAQAGAGCCIYLTPPHGLELEMHGYIGGLEKSHHMDGVLHE